MKDALLILLSIFLAHSASPSAYPQTSAAKLPGYFEENTRQPARDAKFLSRGVGYTLNPGAEPVIGPVLVYSTYLGGSGIDRVHAVAADAFGNMYAAGVTASANFPAANGVGSAYQGNDDAFVVKLSPSGALIYSTYIGGNGLEKVSGIAVTPAGEVILAGETSSGNFPGPRGLGAFVLKLSADGRELYWIRKFGGGSGGVAVDAASNVYVTGYLPAGSSFFAGNCTAPLRAGSEEAFVAKLDRNGNTLYARLLGGSSFENGAAIAADSAGNAIVIGSTNSSDFPLRSAYQSLFAGGTLDLFITKFDTQGQMVFSTYLGGTNVDVGMGVGVDAAQNIYVTGYTQSTDFPTFRALGTHVDYTKGFVSKFNAAGVIQYSTILGGNDGPDLAYAIAVDPEGNAYIIGSTGSSNFPLVHPMQWTAASISGNSFISKLNPTGSALTFSAFFGFAGTNTLTTIALDLTGNLYLGGSSNSMFLPVKDAVQPSYVPGPSSPATGNQPAPDGFVAKIDMRQN